MIDVFVAALGIEIEHVRMVVHGMVGGSVRWAALRLSFGEGSLSVFMGGACALYLGPALVPVLDNYMGGVFDDPTVRARAAMFVAGVLGVSLIGFVIDAWGQIRKLLQDKISQENKHD